MTLIIKIILSLIGALIFVLIPGFSLKNSFKKNPKLTVCAVLFGLTASYLTITPAIDSFIDHRRERAEHVRVEEAASLAASEKTRIQEQQRQEELAEQERIQEQQRQEELAEQERIQEQQRQEELAEQERIQKQLQLEPQEWILQQDPSMLTIQMSASRDRASIESYLARSKLDEPPLSIFTFEREDDTWYGLANGLFDSLGAAESYIDDLPAEALRDRPWIRSVGRIQELIRRAQK